RTRQRNDALSPEFTGAEQLAGGNYVLETNAPDPAAQADRVQEVNMGTGQSRRVRASKVLNLYIACKGFALQTLEAAGTTADINLAFCQFGQQVDTTNQILGMLARNHFRLKRQRIGIHQIDKQCGG